MNIYEWFWRLLPDKCQMPNCRRQGVRGNENRLDDKIVCDDCHYSIMKRKQNEHGIR